MNNFIASLTLLLVVVRLSSSLNCYIDTKGIAEFDVVDKSKFKTFQCNVLKTEHEKPCMTRKDSSGIIRRNCSPVTKDDVCEEDRHGNRYCYCNYDFCNGSDLNSDGC